MGGDVGKDEGCRGASDASKVKALVQAMQVFKSSSASNV